MPSGILTKKEPKDLSFIHRGKEILSGLSSYDIGQSLALCGGNVLAVEALEGTDAMIIRTLDIPKNRRHNLPDPVLFKATKGQTRKADLPAGIKTVENLYKVGFLVQH